MKGRVCDPVGHLSDSHIAYTHFLIFFVPPVCTATETNFESAYGGWSAKRATQSTGSAASFLVPCPVVGGLESKDVGVSLGSGWSHLFTRDRAQVSSSN